MKTYLITGGAGFIGSNFIHYIYRTYGKEQAVERIQNDTLKPNINSNQNFRILNLDSMTYAANSENVKAFNKFNNYLFIEGDICDKKLVTNLINDYEVDTIVHFAAETHVDRCIQDSLPFLTTNVNGTHTLLNSAKQVWESTTGYEGKRFLYVSTDEVYGALGKEGYFKEDSPLHPRNPYSATKAAAEFLCQSFYHTHGFPTLISRCSNNYGPGQHTEKLIPHFIQCILDKKKLPIYGDGTAVRDWLYVKDHCSALDKILNQGKLGEIYNIGCNNEKNTLEIAEILLSILQPEPAVPFMEAVSFVSDRKGHDMRYAIDYGKLKNELGWKPEMDFTKGLKATVNWYLNHLM